MLYLNHKNVKLLWVHDDQQQGQEVVVTRHFNKEDSKTMKTNFNEGRDLTRKKKNNGKKSKKHEEKQQQNFNNIRLYHICRT